MKAPLLLMLVVATACGELPPLTTEPQSLNLEDLVFNLSSEEKLKLDMAGIARGDTIHLDQHMRFAEDAGALRWEHDTLDLAIELVDGALDVRVATETMACGKAEEVVMATEEDAGTLRLRAHGLVPCECEVGRAGQRVDISRFALDLSTVR